MLFHDVCYQSYGFCAILVKRSNCQWYERSTSFQMAFNASIRAYRRIIQNSISSIPTPFSNANTAASNQLEIAVVQIAGGHEVETNTALTRLLTHEFKEEIYAIPERQEVQTTMALPHLLTLVCQEET